MQNYLDLVKKIFDEETDLPRGDRTGVGTIGIFAHQMRWNLQDGFPLVTTKTVHLRSIIHELLWFIQGDTNTKYLTDNAVTIWNEWAVENDTEVPYTTATLLDLAEWLVDQGYAEINIEAKQMVNDAARRPIPGDIDAGYCAAERAARRMVLDGIIPDKAFSGKKYRTVPQGDLGPVYGKMFRSYPTVNHRGTVVEFDQLRDTVNQLRTNPFSRRHVINLWHPGLAPDETKSPQENVLEGRQALAPCHYGLQFYVKQRSVGNARAYFNKYLAEQYPGVTDIEEIVDLAMANGWREWQLSLKFQMRSTDCMLGLPYNIASYALLLHMVALELDYMPDELVYDGGDVHIYSNHYEGAREQLKREPRALPRLFINRPAGTKFDDIRYEDFHVIGYNPHPVIKFPIAI